MDLFDTALPILRLHWSGQASPATELAVSLPKTKESDPSLAVVRSAASASPTSEGLLLQPDTTGCAQTQVLPDRRRFR